MFAVDHAATALVIKRRFPSVSMTPLLVSVQAMELAWVALNSLGVERTTTASTVRSVADIHLAYMPYSHSVATVMAASLATWWIIERGLGRRALGRAVAVGIVSHLVLDIATHAPDIALWPGSRLPQLGLGLYSAAPGLAFVVELSYGILCWWIYRGRRALLYVLVVRECREHLVLLRRNPGSRAIACRTSDGRRDRRLCSDRHDARLGGSPFLDARGATKGTNVYARQFDSSIASGEVREVRIVDASPM